MNLGLFAAAAAYVVALGLILFSARRLLFCVVAFASSTRARSQGGSPGFCPTVTLLMPARDEESSVGKAIEAVARLDYPPDRLQVFLLDDCSRDRTPEIMRSYAEAHAHFRYYRLPGSGPSGKASVLNYALSLGEAGEVIYVVDADSILDPACVRLAVQHFANERVGAVSGAPFPSGNCSGFASYYAYLETIVHQAVTTRAKDVLRWAPGMFGSNFAYRRSAVERIGGFKDGCWMEDEDLVLALYAAGYTTRFEPGAISHLAMPRTLSSYFHQHARWTRGFIEVLFGQGAAVLSRRNLSPLVRLELCLFASGYLDRAFLLVGSAMAATDLVYGRLFGFPVWVLAVSLLSPLASIVSALVICREPLVRHWRVLGLPLFYAVDVASALKGLLDSATHVSRIWTKVEREA